MRGTLATAFIVIFGVRFLVSLQNHLSETRVQVDNADHESWLRGSDVLFALVGAVVASGVVVGYSLWRAIQC